MNVKQKINEMVELSLNIILILINVNELNFVFEKWVFLENKKGNQKL